MQNALKYAVIAMSMMIIIPGLKKTKKVRINKDLRSGSYASRPKNSPQKSFSLSNQQAVFFLPFFKYHVLFQDQSEVEIDMIEVSIL